MTSRVVVIGGGIGGLTSAALLLRAGLQVTVLEAEAYPGGSAGTFYHKGYRFDAGATLAGGFSAGGPHARVGALLGLDWPVRPADPAWVVHLPDLDVTQYAERARWQAERQRAFPGSEHFWKLQEQLAEESWRISSLPFPWPPEHPADLARLLAALRPSTLPAAVHALRSLASLLPRPLDPALRAFLDAQLLISAQTTSARANALYACAALDLPRRGVNHIRGGIGSLARCLADWINAHGGKVLYHQRATHLALHRQRVKGVHTEKGLDLPADWVVANLTPAALAGLLGEAAPTGLRREVAHPRPGWGAFVLYLGLDGAGLPAGLADHHQVVADPLRPLGEGNSIFLSLSDPLDASRAPAGHRATTISTHTAVEPWWDLFNHDPDGYSARKEHYTQLVLDTAERAIPGLRGAIRLCLPGTPVTFQSYLGRPLGLVGGTPQTSLLASRGPGTGLPNLRLVGDSIFPGQSTAGVTLGAMRVAAEIAALA